MRVISAIVTAFVASLAISCGSSFGEFTGTGQQGEAKIIGVAMTSTGAVASNQKLTVADYNFVQAESSITRAAEFTIDTIFTDENGRFTINLIAGQVVTISGKLGNEFIYVPSVTVDSGNNDLGSVAFVPGKAIKVYPWWIKDGLKDRFVIPGTDLGYILPDDSVSTIYAPTGVANLMHYDQGNVETVPVSTTLGDSAKWDSSAVGSSYTVSTTAITYTPVKLELLSPYNQSMYQAYVIWDQNTQVVDTSNNGVSTYAYTQAGTYMITFKLYRVTENNVPITPILVFADTAEILVSDTLI